MNYTKKSWLVSLQEQEIFIFCKSPCRILESDFGADSVVFLRATPRELTVLLTVLNLRLLLQES